MRCKSQSYPVIVPVPGDETRDADLELSDEADDLLEELWRPFLSEAER